MLHLTDPIREAELLQQVRTVSPDTTRDQLDTIVAQLLDQNKVRLVAFYGYCIGGRPV